MKKTLVCSIIFLTTLLMINSCSKSGASGNTCSWSCEVNGQSYAWSGTYPDNNYAASALAESALSISAPRTAGSTKIPFGLTISFGSLPDQGTYIFSSANSNNNYTALIQLNGVIGSSSYPGSNFNITLSSVPSNSFISTGGSNPGFLSGTFSGTIYGIDPTNPSVSKEYIITNGKFNAIRIQ